LRVGPLTVERADVSLAFATLDAVRDGRGCDDADERGLVRVSLRDAIRVPRQDWIADSEGAVYGRGCDSQSDERATIEVARPTSGDRPYLAAGKSRSAPGLGKDSYFLVLSMSPARSCNVVERTANSNTQ
jgi:hypothetical protein